MVQGGATYKAEHLVRRTMNEVTEDGTLSRREDVGFRERTCLDWHDVINCRILVWVPCQASGTHFAFAGAVVVGRESRKPPARHFWSRDQR
jgi:hypothetical protein